MKKFLFKVLGFICLIILFCFLLLFLPPTPRASKSFLFAETKKDLLLMNAESPRIIFVGGSNLSFGLNCQTIKDLLNVNPVNTGISAYLGLKYMLDNTYQYVKKGDIVVVVPEYEHFYKDYDCSSGELLRLVSDVNKSKIRLLSLKQIIACIPYTRQLIYSKLQRSEYINVEESDFYSVNSFNKYGDAYAHWDLDRREFSVSSEIEVKAYNPRVMGAIKEFEEKIQKKSAMLYVSYPSLQDISFDISIEAINNVEKEFIKHEFEILGNPRRYRMNDTMMFDTPYHLNRSGLELRTQLLIEDMIKAGVGRIF